MVDKRAFREDLYARLSGWVLPIAPPARAARRHPAPVQHFVRKYAKRHVPLHTSFALRLLRYDYPRNVRELEKIIERALIESNDDALRMSPGVEQMMGGESSRAAAPATAAVALPRRHRGARPGPEELRRMLERHQGNVTHLAQALGIGRNTLYRWLKAAGVELQNLRGG